VSRFPTREQNGEPFSCIHCKNLIDDRAPGTDQRNHCPRCLWSKHVDFRCGDRRSACQAAMEPIAVWVKPNGEWSIIHMCRACGAIRANRIAGDDNELVLLSLAIKPLARPAFPLDKLDVPGY
jgi:hypothetical protein